MDPPPAYSLTPPTELPPVSRWHPKMSPYRVFVLTTTIILGTLKAVFAYRGALNSSTTVEWVGGVVFTLLAFVLDELESKESFPKYLQWFFSFDCMDLMWGALRILAVSQPKYRSDVVSNGSIKKISFVPITGYRTLVSATVVVLGSVKAALAYLGHDTTANSFDWTLGVFMTSLLYYIGLYESNPVHFAPNFFVHDHNVILVRVLRDRIVVVMFSLGMTIYLAVQWIPFCLSGFKNSLLALPSSSESKSFLILQTLGVFMLCVWLFCLTLSFSVVVAASITILWAVQKESELFSFLFRRGKFIKLYDITISRVSRVAASLPLLFKLAQRAAYLVLWITGHLFCIITLGSFIGIFIGVMQDFGADFDLYAGLSVKLLWHVTIQVPFGLYIIAAFCGIFYLVRSLVSPFPSFAKTFGFV